MLVFCLYLYIWPEKVKQFIKQWYSAEYSILEEKQTLEGCQLMMKEKDRKVVKGIENVVNLQWIFNNILPIFSKKSTFIHQIPFYCFFLTLCISLLYNAVFIFTAQTANFSKLLLCSNMCGQLLVWWSFYKIYNASPIPIAPDLYQKFSDAVHARASSVTKHGDNGSCEPKVCYRCRILQTPGIGHCGYLSKCVVNYDHFCLFLWSSIHSTNYIYFYTYLVSMFLTMLVLMYTLVLYIQYSMRMGIQSENTNEAAVTMGSNAGERGTLQASLTVRAAVTYLLWMVLMWLFVSCLLVYHTQSILRGQTSRQRTKQQAFSGRGDGVSGSSFCDNLYALSVDAFERDNISNCNKNPSEKRRNINNNHEEMELLYKAV